MSMLDYSEITVRKYIVYESEPYEVMENHIFRMQQRKPQNKTKIKNLLTGRISDITFHAADKVEEAEINTREAKFLYNSKNEWWFVDPEVASKRFKISEELLGIKTKFLLPNSIYALQVYIAPGADEADGVIFDIRLPATVDLEVVEAPPGIKGDTARGGGKQIVLKGGLVVTAPLFVNVGDMVKVNTDTGEYRERLTK